jgi:uncharacterized membrane-anchored protein
MEAAFPDSFAARPASARPRAISSSTHGTFNKVARVGAAFWVIKILATTLGETGGDTLSMQFGLGYAASTAIFLLFFAVALAIQLATKRYHPAAFWTLVVATTTVGTTTSDYIDRTLGLGYVTSSACLFAAVVAVLAIWRWRTGSIAVTHISTRTNEIFYWVTILIANTLGTALGDFTASTAGTGFEGGALLFAGLLAIVAALRWFTAVPAALSFWAAYVLTRPLGATLGDLLTKPHAEGGLDLSRLISSLVIAVLMVVAIALTSQRTSDGTG